MPTVYRSMFADQGKPRVGKGNRTLGIRIAPDPHADIPVDAHGHVQPGSGGMSVAPGWRQLTFFLIPERLKPEVPGARGSNDLVCWRLGEGPFAAAEVAKDLSLRLDPKQPDR